MFNRREKLILGLMSAVQFCLIVDFMVIMPQGPQLMRTFDITAQQFGLLVSAYTLGAGIMSLIASFFIDRFDRKHALILVFAIFALCNIQCALAGTYSSLLLARFMTGASSGVVGALIFSTVSDSIDIDRRASALGIIMAAFAIASIVGVPICLILANRIGWAAPFIFLAGLTFLICVILHLRLPKMNIHLSTSTPKLGRALSEFTQLISEKNRAISLVFMACLMLGHFSINPFLFPSVVANAKVTETQLPVVYLVGGFASILASVITGKVSDKLGKKPVFVVALLGSLAAIYFVTHLQPTHLFYTTLIVTSFFVLMGGRLTPATALITMTAPPQNRGALLSLIGSVQQLSAALGTYLAGLIVVKAADGQLLRFEYVGVMAIGFSLVALLLILKIRPTEERAPA